MSASVLSFRSLALVLPLLSALGACGPGGPSDPSKTLTVATTGSGAGTVASDHGGISCSTGTPPGICDMPLPVGEFVTLTAAPGASSVFMGWSGCKTATSPTITLSQPLAPAPPVDLTCTARFEPGVTVSVLVAGAGTGNVTSTPAGINCPPTCTANFMQSSLVTLTAAPASSSDFAGWSGGLFCPSPTNPVLTFTAAASVTCTVRFDPKSTAGVAVFTDDFDDGFGALARWQAVQRVSTGGASHSVTNPITNGVPLTGGYRAGTHDFPAPGQLSVTHVYLGDGTPARPGVYNPAVSGQVDSLVVSMDVIVLAGTAIGAAFQVRQGQGYYFASIHPGDVFQNTGWVRVRKKLVASDFLQVPDFTQPMEFAFLRGNTTAGTGVSTTWGTDNFRVEVWHR